LDTTVTQTDRDVVIIGAGIIGCALAFELAKRGYKTLNLDTLPAAGYGSTSDSCAIVRAHYSTLQGVTMAYEAFQYWHDWEAYLGVGDERGLAQFVNTGTVALKAEGLNWKKVLGHYEAVGVEYEEWDASTLAERLPYLDLGSFWPPSRPDEDAFWNPSEGEITGAIFTPGSGYVNDPQLATHNLQVAAEAHGARFRFGAQVEEIHCEEGGVRGVVVDGERIEARIVVNVAGPHSKIVNEMAGALDDMNISTRPLRHEVHLVPAPPGIDFERDGYHVNDGDNVVYFRPETGNHILVGSDDPPCDEKEWLDDPDELDRTISKSQWEAQVYRLARRIPSLEIPRERKGIVGLYDVSDDWLPIYDRSGIDGFYLAVGTSGNQFKTAPVAARLVAEIIDACEHGHDHDAAPIQVPCHYLDATLETSTFSRLREINRESSFSVNG
jgi:sarcosine oxidase subunit beta